MASGFGSLRRFNDLFGARYHLSPTSLRRQTGQAVRTEGQNISLMLGYRPPYDWERLLAFLAPRAIPGVEIVRDSAYYRTVRLVKAGWDGSLRLDQGRKRVRPKCASASPCPRPSGGAAPGAGAGQGTV